MATMIEEEKQPVKTLRFEFNTYDDGTFDVDMDFSDDMMIHEILGAMQFIAEYMNEWHDKALTRLHETLTDDPPGSMTS
jgi:ABC-type uncharacterized transport system substrate-binding protein